MKDNHHEILRKLSNGPKDAVEISRGLRSGFSPQTIQKALNELRDVGYVRCTQRGVYSATSTGEAAIIEVLQRTAPRTFCNSSTKEKYAPPSWPVRDGANDHFGCSRVGHPT